MKKISNLVIVESPTKARTIGAFLGNDYKILSSYGHVRDLPKSALGIDTENNFKIKYVIPTKSRKNVNLLKKEVEKADMIYIATDPDREGEAIAWHLIEILGLGKDKDYQRITFHEITPLAINTALKKPHQLDINLVNAQQARRALDRIVGYKLSPLLWKKIARHLSAGRVQSVALKLIVDREREIEKFIPEEYWTISGLFENNNKKVEATLSKIKGKKAGIKNQKEAEKTCDELRNKEYKISKLEKKTIKRNPLPPFTTSTMQQEASKKLRFPSSLTMRVAQELYEKGYITYHRTDSLNLSSQSINAAKIFIENQFGKGYSSGGRKFKTNKRAQEAHEAIRPTEINNTPDKLKLDDKQKKLYNLIWTRFTASQMKEALFDSVKLEISSKEKDSFEATGLHMLFDGFIKIYPIKIEEKEIPEFNEEDLINLLELKPFQHFTKPKARYNEASLIKELENNEIGRPSTYAPTILTIQKRNYVEKNKEKRFAPTEIGFSVNDLLAEHFPEIIDIKFTAKMEKNLDEVAQEGKNWIELLKEFYLPFNEKLEKKHKEIEKKPTEHKPANKDCPKCGKPLLIKKSRFGEFMACSGFPECRYTESIENEKTKTGIICPKCEQGEIITKKTKKGKIFYGCSKWPDCDFASWYKPTGERCPNCNSLLIEKGKKIVCENKSCGYVKK